MSDKSHHKGRSVRFTPSSSHEMSRLAKWLGVFSLSSNSSVIPTRRAVGTGVSKTLLSIVTTFCGDIRAGLGALRARLSMSSHGCYSCVVSTMLYCRRSRAAIIGSASIDALAEELRYSGCEWRFASFEPAHTNSVMGDEGKQRESEWEAVGEPHETAP